MRVLSALLAASACLVAAAHAQDGTRPDVPSVTVRGEASASVVPDTVVVVFGVVTTRPGAAEAMAENSKALADAIATIKAAGIKPEDIATTNAGLTPETSQNGNAAPKIVGYRAEDQLQVRLQPADRAGAILAKVVDKGVNDVESVTPIASDDAALRDRLKGEAARDARRQAALYAAALDLKLGTVLRIDPEPGMIGARMASAAKYSARDAVPVEVGQQTVTEAVRVTFALQP